MSTSMQPWQPADLYDWSRHFFDLALVRVREQEVLAKIPTSPHHQYHFRGYQCELRCDFVTLLSLQEINRETEILCRDGAYALFFFLRRFEPGKVRPRLIIHSELAALVPDSWKSKIQYFDYYTQSTKSLPAPSKAIVIGNSMDFSSMGEDAFRKIPSAIKDISYWISGHSSSQSPATPSAPNNLIVEANSRMFYSDSYLFHQILSQGRCQILPAKKTGRKVGVSPYHGFIIKSSP